MHLRGVIKYYISEFTTLTEQTSSVKGSHHKKTEKFGKNSLVGGGGGEFFFKKGNIENPGGGLNF